ncbi:MAG: cupin domain-containing protein [Phocaeicola sp.]
MEKKTGFKSGEPFNLSALVEYTEGGVVSKQISKNVTGNVTLFSFDEGQGLSPHTAPFDALVQILDGEAEITLDGKRHQVKCGEMIIMPAHVMHALHAAKRFKMLLTMIKG